MNANMNLSQTMSVERTRVLSIGRRRLPPRALALLLVASSTYLRSDAAATGAFVPSSCRRGAGIVESSRRCVPCAPSSVRLYLKKGGKRKKKVKDNTITVNKLAYRNYEVVDTIEAGISLKGTEVKSIRDGKMNIRDGYVKAEKNGRTCTLHNVHIGKHSMSAEYFQHEERRPRQLLLHKEQSRRLLQQTERQGMTIVPLKAYFNDRNMVKFEIGLCRGKNVRDKRADIKEREAKREANRMVKNFRL